MKEKFLFIGDIAGRFDELNEIVNLHPNHTKIAVGDLQDRGMQSKEVLDFIMLRPDFKAIFGNHEELFLDFVDTPGFNENWLMFLLNGGLTTLYSYLPNERKNDFLNKIPKYKRLLKKYINTYAFKYNDNYKHAMFLLSNTYKYKKKQYAEMEESLLDAKSFIKKKYIDYIRHLPRIIETNEWICSHAPLKENLSKTYIEGDDFLWNRYPACDKLKDQIYGHNGISKIEVRHNGFKVVCVDNSHYDMLCCYDYKMNIMHTIKYKRDQNI